MTRETPATIPAIVVSNRLEVQLAASKDAVRLDEPLTVTVNCQLQGPLRGMLNQKVWTHAYNEHDILFLARYNIVLRGGGLLRRTVGKAYVKKKAKFYWCRNPDRLNEVWVMTVDEFGMPSNPVSEVEVQAQVFDVSRTFQLLGADIGKWRSRLQAEVTLKWGRHVFSEKGTASARSNPIHLSVR